MLVVQELDFQIKSMKDGSKIKTTKKGKSLFGVHILVQLYFFKDDLLCGRPIKLCIGSV